MKLLKTSLIANRWKRPECPSAEKRMHHMGDVHAMECYLALKRKEIRTHATTQMNFEDSMLSEVCLKRTNTI